MMKEEFEEKVSKVFGLNAPIRIKDDEYRVIEYVYTYYPEMDKQRAAQLYAWFGVKIFEDLEERASKIDNLETILGTARKKVIEIQEELKELGGHIT